MDERRSGASSGDRTRGWAIDAAPPDAALSFGVLAALLRALELRDPRLARHSAAVARFCHDIAEAAGMSDENCELAHVAGLLHDIGHLALPDRVLERGARLNDADWEAIRRHPELGAQILRDLGPYDAVAEIVLCHHERIDGRGYPLGLVGDEIPAIARIIPVAGLYDTLTASDTYRSPISSFAALHELRRVTGTQVDAEYVDAFVQVLAGKPADYRCANRADFDRELELARKKHIQLARQAG